MAGWLNWLELQKHNDWGMRDQDNATAAMWDAGADVWEARSQASRDYAQKQVALLDIRPTDTVLDVCCGTGPLTNLLAARAACVTALDYGEHMLQYVRAHAQQAGLSNVKTLQGNWYHLTPGVDFPRHDVAVTRHSPAQCDILKFSACATRYCYSICDCYTGIDETKAPRNTWIRSARQQGLEGPPRPDARLYGFNIHFNILYDHGANPTVNYARHVYEKRADTVQEILDAFFPMLPDALRPMIEAKIDRLPDGQYHYRAESCAVVLGWDPNELHLPEAQR